MPRNIEINLERYCEEGALEKFILTAAISYGIQVPSESLELCGMHYGFDNFFVGELSLKSTRNRIENYIRDIEAVKHCSVDEIELTIKNEYLEKLKDYENAVDKYFKDIKPIETMLQRILNWELPADKYIEFKDSLIEYLENAKGEKPKKENLDLIMPSPEEWRSAKIELFEKNLLEARESEKVKMRKLYEDSTFVEEMMLSLKK